MSETDSPTTSPEDAGHTPPGDRWDTSGLPPEPPKGSAVVDRDGNAWVRPFDESQWQRGNYVAKWPSLMIDCGPLTRLVPADPEREQTVARLINSNDQLRAQLTRYRGTPAMQEAARKVVAAGSETEQRRAIDVLARLVDEGAPARRTVTYDREEIVRGMAAANGIDLDAERQPSDLRTEAAAQGVDVDREYRDAIRDLIAGLRADGPGLRWVRTRTDDEPDRKITLAEAVNAVRMDWSTDRTTVRFRAAVVREARRLIDQYDDLADGEVVTLSQLREAVRALDEHLTRKDQELMRVTTQYTFDGSSRSVERKGTCPTCHKPVTRRRTFQHTVSPFNKDPETGQPRTWAQVAERVRAEADAWNPTPEEWEHQRCYDARNAPQTAGYEPVGEDELARAARERDLALRWISWVGSTGLPLYPVPDSWHTNRDTTKASVYVHARARNVCAIADSLGVTEVKINRTDGDLAVRFIGKIPDGTVSVEVAAYIEPTARGVAGKVDRPKGETLTVDELAAWIETTGQVQVQPEVVMRARMRAWAMVLRAVLGALLAGLTARIDPARPVARAEGREWVISVGGQPLYRIRSGFVQDRSRGDVKIHVSDPGSRDVGDLMRRRAERERWTL